MEVTVRDRSALTSAAGWLLGGTLLIVIDVRFDTFDILADLVGAALVAVGVWRLDVALSGADGRRMTLKVLAMIGLVAGALDTFTVQDPLVAWLGLAQVVGALVLANVLADATRQSEPSLSGVWRTTHRLVLWLGLVPFVVATVLGTLSGGVTIETPLVIPLVIILALPLGTLLYALYRTRQAPNAEVPVAAG